MNQALDRARRGERKRGREEREKEGETEEMRSSIGALRDDTPKRHPAELPARISVPREKWGRP